MIRTEKITSLHPNRTPQRVIIIKVTSRQTLDNCFASEDYQKIMHKRIDSVDARALIVE